MWINQTIQSPDLSFEADQNGMPRSFMQWSQFRRRDRFDNFYDTVFRRLVPGPFEDWDDPEPQPEVPNLVRYSNFGRHRFLRGPYHGGYFLDPL